MKKTVFTLALGAVFLIGLSDSIIYRKIRKTNTKVNELIETKVNKLIDHSFCSEQAMFIEGEMFREYAETKIAPLRRGVDTRSNEVLDYVITSLLYTRFYKNSVTEKIDISFPENHAEHAKRYYAEQSSIERKYDLCGYYEHTPEIFYFHHGLRFANPKVLEYIKDKDILDCGSFIGDSVLVLQNYTDATIYCYEFSRANLEAFKEVMNRNSVSAKYVIVPVALSDEVGTIHISDCGVNAGQQLQKGNGYIVKKTTIDEEAKEREFRVGLIKADLEGHCLHMIKGAINTIKKHRPVLSLGIYHNTEELLKVKPYLEGNLENYVFEFHLQRFGTGNYNDMILFCYPKEILENH